MIDLVADTIKIYIDGILDSTHTALGMAAATDNTNSGPSTLCYDFVTPSQFFPGLVSDFRCYVNDTGWTDDMVKSVYRMNGHDGRVGNAQDQLQMRYQFDFNNGGSAITVANLYDTSGAQIAGSVPTAIVGAPVYRDYKEAFRRVVH